MKKIIVIGSGLGGMSAAALLAKNGFDVHVYEKNDGPGGVASRIDLKGFTFDTGPTWYLMPEVFENYFGHFNKKVTDYLSFQDLDPSYKIYFQKNDSVTITRDAPHNEAVFKSIEKNGDVLLREYLEESKYKYDTAMNEFLYRDYNSVFDFFNRRLMTEGLKLRIFEKLDNYIKRFFKEKKARKILEYNIVFLGCSPFKSPALFSLMSHVDITQGVKYPDGGIFQLSLALEKLSKEQGVEFHYNSQVKRILTEKNKSTGVLVNGKRINADIVISAVDYCYAENELLDIKKRSYSQRYWKKRILAPSAMIILLGLNKKIHNLEHHTLFLAEKWEEHFKSIFDDPSWPEDASYYVGCPSKTDSSAAPEGKENLFILVPLSPHLDDTESRRESFSNAIIADLEKKLGEEINESIEVKKILTHRDFISRYNLHKGAALGLAHTLFQTAGSRPTRKSRKISNLYFNSQWTHPGIGMPMVMIGGELTAEKIMEDYS